jgi:hypothetical protein
VTGELFRVGVVLSPRAWSGRLHAFIADHVPGVELVMVRDQQAAIEALPHVLLIDDSTPWLTPSFVDRADGLSIRLVGVYDRRDGSVGQSRLAELGLTHLLEEEMPPDDVVFLLDRLRPAAGTERPTIGRGDDADDAGGEPGSIVAVGGPSGSGAREVAVGLVGEWAGLGWRTLLVDTNEITPGVARRLGVSTYPHLLTAIDRLGAEGVAGIEASLGDVVGGRRYDVIAGIPTTRDWDRLVPNDVEALLDTCRNGWDRIVVTSSPLIEDLQRWGDRFGVSRRVLAIADGAIGCCEPTPRGVLRYLDWIAETSRLRSDVVTVLNKVPRSRRVAAEANRQLRDVGGALIDDVFEVPFDRRVAAAEWDGVDVNGGSFRKALEAIALELDYRLRQPKRLEVPS